MATQKKQPATDKRSQDSAAPAIRPALAQGLNLLVRPDGWGRVSAITQTISRVLAYNHLTAAQQSLPRRLVSNRVLSNRVVLRYGQFYSQLGPLNRSVRYRRRKNAPLTDAVEDNSPDYDLSEPEAPTYEFAEPAAPPVLRREYRPVLERPRLGDAPQTPAVPPSFYQPTPQTEPAFTSDDPAVIARFSQEIEPAAQVPAFPNNPESAPTRPLPVVPTENSLLAGRPMLGSMAPAETRFATNSGAASSTLQRLLTNLQRVNHAATTEPTNRSADLTRPANLALNYARRPQMPGMVARSSDTAFGFEPGVEAAFASSFAPQPGLAREVAPSLGQSAPLAQSSTFAPQRVDVPSQTTAAVDKSALPAESANRTGQPASSSGEAVVARTETSANSSDQTTPVRFSQDNPAQSGQVLEQTGRPVLQRQNLTGQTADQLLAEQADTVTGEGRSGMRFSSSVAKRPAMGSWAGTLAALQFNPALTNSTLLRSFQPSTDENASATPASFASEPAQRMVWHALHRNPSTVRREMSEAATEQPFTSTSETAAISPVSLANSEPLVFSPAQARSQAMLTTDQNGQSRVEMPPLLQRAIAPAPEVSTLPGTGVVDRRQVALQQTYNAVAESGAVGSTQAGQPLDVTSAPAGRIGRLPNLTGPTPLQRLMQQAASLSDEAAMMAQSAFEAQPEALSYARPGQPRRVQAEMASSEGETAFESQAFEGDATPSQPIQRYYQPQVTAQETVQRFEQVSRPGVLSGLLPGIEPALPALTAAPRVDRWGAALPALQFNPGVTTQQPTQAEPTRSTLQSVPQTGANVALARTFAGEVTRQGDEEAYQAGWDATERNLAAPGQVRRSRMVASEDAYQTDSDAFSQNEAGQIQALGTSGVNASQESQTVQRQVNQGQTAPVEQAGNVVNEADTADFPASAIQRSQVDNSGETQERLSSWLARSTEEGSPLALGGERLRLNNPTPARIERELAEPGYSESAVDGGLVYRQPGRPAVRSARAENSVDFAGEGGLTPDTASSALNSNEPGISPTAANSLLRQVQRTLANSQAEVSQRLNGFLARVADENAMPKIGGERLRLGWMEAEASAAQPGNETVQRTLRLGQPGSRTEQPSYNDMGDGLNGDLAYTRPPLIERRANYQRPVEGDDGAAASPDFESAVANLMAELGLDSSALGGGDRPTVQRTRSDEGAWSADALVSPPSAATPDGAAVWKPLDLSYAEPPKLDQREPPRKPNLGNPLEARSGVLPGLKLATQASRDERTAPTGFQPAPMVLRNSAEPGNQSQSFDQDSQGDSSALLAPGDAPLSTYFEGPAERPIGVMGVPQLPMIQRKATGSGPAQVQRSFDTLMRSSVGQPLHSEVQSRMSGMFGNRFEQVKVHTDNVAGDYAKEMGAEAFTVGSSIFFAPGRYQPESAEGQALIGHELTHVVQQANLPALTDRAIPETSAHGQAMEHEAQHNERLLLNHLTNQPPPVMRVSGETQLSIPVPPPTPAPVVQRSFEPLPPVHIRQEVSRQEELPPGSTVQRVITNEINNSLSNSSSEGVGQSFGGNGNAKIDIDEITEQVYRRLRQRLIVERERGGPSGGRFF